MTQELTLHFYKSDAWNISGSGASTSDYTFVFILGLAAILLVAFLIYKRKNKALLCIPVLLALVCAGFAFGADNSFNGSVDPDGSVKFDYANICNTEAYDMYVTGVSVEEINATNGAKWILRSEDKTLFEGKAGETCLHEFVWKTNETLKLSLESDIDKNTCLNLIDKDVLRFKFNIKAKVTLLNVDETSAGSPIYVNKGEKVSLPSSATPPPRTAPNYWDFDGWYDKDGNAIDTTKAVNEDMTVYAHYKDKVVPLQEGYDCDNFMTKGKRGKAQQGCDIYNDLIFSGEDGGHVNIYKFSDGGAGDNPVDPIGGFELASSHDDNHVNNIEFGQETKPGATYPLMYISNGKVGSEIEFVCYVESITKKDDTYSSELAQQIWIEPKHRDTWRAKGYVPIFGSPSWMIDRTRGDLWIFSAYQRTTPKVTTANWQNEYIATKFRLPKLSDGEIITLTADDILDQVIFPYETCFTQAGYMIDGLIYYCFGVGTTNDPTRPPRIRIYDTNTKTITTGYNLNVELEPEDIFIKDNYLYLNANSAQKTQGDPKIYKISMPKE